MARDVRVSSSNLLLRHRGHVGFDLMDNDLKPVVPAIWCLLLQRVTRG